MIPPFVLFTQDAPVKEKRVLINLDQVTFIDVDPSTRETRVWFPGFHCERVTESIDTVMTKLGEFAMDEKKAGRR